MKRFAWFTVSLCLVCVGCGSALPDGAGGFYLGGDFTHIGEKARYYLARFSPSTGP